VIIEKITFITNNDIDIDLFSDVLMETMLPFYYIDFISLED
jgi:hypothetical protein